MGLGHALYLILIYPLQLLFEFAFSISSKHVSNYGYAIICLSLIVNIVVLPLYIRADKIQNEQREIEKKLNPGINHIKKSFSGDERFMMLQMYYKLNSYNPIMSLRSATSLLLQVPFFMAAYNLLSTLRCLNGVSFWFIKDLSQPDALFHIGTFSINVLPILMTLINVISGLVYTKGHPLKEKIQINGMAALFLVLLYNSPAALTFYWTLNNVFSLVKNIVNYFFAKLIDVNKTKKSISKLSAFIPRSTKTTGFQFVLSQLAKVSLIAFYVPSFILAASPLEFMDSSDMSNPVKYLGPSVLIGLGILVVWEYVIYWLLPSKGKTIYSYISVGLFMFFMANYFYATDVMKSLDFLIAREITYVFVIIFSVGLFLLINKYSKFLINTAIAATLVFTLFVGFSRVNDATNHYNDFHQPENKGELQINLSTEGTNVIVIMLDRSIGYTMPYELEMFPELSDIYDGFVYYPNTVSFAGHTNLASPALFGGYEYTPEMINMRPNESLESKHNEALKVLPTIFSAEGYSVTVVDPPYAGYEHIPETIIYDDLANVSAYYTGSDYNQYADTINPELNAVRNRDFFIYGLCKCMVYGQDVIYDYGNYQNPNRTIYGHETSVNSISLTGECYKALDHYGVLNSLISMTNIYDDNSNHLLVFQNELTHDSLEPSINYIDPRFDYEEFLRQSETICGDNEGVKVSFLSTATSLFTIGDWLEYLKTNGVYDNTRIIIVSDHGHPTGFTNNPAMEYYSPLLLYKDFNSHGFEVSNEFMTNADTPYLAVNSIFENPVNPYTGNIISNDYKNNLPIKISNSHDLFIAYNNGNTFTNSNNWYEITDTNDIYNSDNWQNVIEEGA
ncbi:MAG: membrane protein insertase YidC [Saccharofermentans sp.]|nr:membrane protein insertase YidC [Saccharofermentans sp.]